MRGPVATRPCFEVPHILLRMRVDMLSFVRPSRDDDEADVGIGVPTIRADRALTDRGCMLRAPRGAGKAVCLMGPREKPLDGEEGDEEAERTSAGRGGAC